LARDAVQFRSRELSDPKGALANAPVKQRQKPDQRTPDLPPDVMAEIIEKAIRQSYANWPDEPIPALGGKTPRQAIRTPAGLERVKGLLRG
jgi:antitoxin Xre/MbcA/ParS-like protein